jgi:hypothetical protein
MSSRDAEDLVEKQAMKFEAHKDYLIQVWGEKATQTMTVYTKQRGR